MPEGDEFLVANVLQQAGTAIPGLPLPEGAKRVLSLDKFLIDYRADGSIAQYRSVLTARDLDGNAVGQKEIYVNEPFRFGGVTLYQVHPYVMHARMACISPVHIAAPNEALGASAVHA